MNKQKLDNEHTRRETIDYTHLSARASQNPDEWLNKKKKYEKHTKYYNKQLLKKGIKTRSVSEEMGTRQAEQFFKGTEIKLEKLNILQRFINFFTGKIVFLKITEYVDDKVVRITVMKIINKKKST